MQVAYIFGHKMPDTDSVCASISLSYLKNKMGLKTEPRVLGALNKETKFVLDYFNVPEPQFLNDVKVQIKNMHYNREAMVEALRGIRQEDYEDTEAYAERCVWQDIEEVKFLEDSENG